MITKYKKEKSKKARAMTAKKNPPLEEKKKPPPNIPPAPNTTQETAQMPQYEAVTTEVIFPGAESMPQESEFTRLQEGNLFPFGYEMRPNFFGQSWNIFNPTLYLENCMNNYHQQGNSHEKDQNF